MSEKTNYGSAVKEEANALIDLLERECNIKEMSMKDFQIAHCSMRLIANVAELLSDIEKKLDKIDETLNNM